MAFALLWATFDFLRNADANRFLVVGVAIVVGVGGVFFLYWAMNRIVDLLPDRYREGVRPYVFVGPALVILGVFLVYPVINTLLISLKDAQGEGFVGLDNFKFVFTDESMLRAIRNTLGWIVLVPLFAVSIGLAFATLADRLRRGEAVAKSLIFMPMAISFAGAAITWRLIYDFRPQGFGSNIGLLNGVCMGLGHQPVPWLQQAPWNNLLLMVIMVWMQMGFAMVVLSAAIKAIPEEITEAARIDGASEFQVFRRIIVPSIASYDRRRDHVHGHQRPEGLRHRLRHGQRRDQQDRGDRRADDRLVLHPNNAGRGAAIAVVLFAAIIPVMVWNMKRFREQEMTR